MTSSAHLSPPATITNRPSFLRTISSSSTATNVSSKKNKPRLYLALFAKGGANPSCSYNANTTCDSYHWTLLIGPKTASRSNIGTCYQLVHSNSTSNGGTPSSYYEETDLTNQSLHQSQTLLVRITLAKVLDKQRIQTLLRSLPPSTPPRSSDNKSRITVTQHHNSSDYHHHNDPSHQISCHTWIRAAYHFLTSDPAKPLRSWIGPDDWKDIDECARGYAKKKRNQGRFVFNVAPGEDDHNPYRPWKEDEIATWNFWEKRETTN